MNMRRMLGTLLTLCMVISMLPMNVFAADYVKANSEAVVNQDSVIVYSGKPISTDKSVYAVETLKKGDRVEVIQAYSEGTDHLNSPTNFHYVKTKNNKKGYTFVLKGTGQTLRPLNADEIAADEQAERAEAEAKAKEQAEKEAQAKAEAEKKADIYKHDIDMDYLSDYIYGGSKALTGYSYGDLYGKGHGDFTRHDRPEDLKLVGRAVLHIGDAGKDGIVEAAFYPGSAPVNYHQQRLDDLQEIGYYPIMGNPSANQNNANTAFYAYTGSEYEVVAYNDTWVAVWDKGGLDTSQGVGNPCGGAAKAQYASWKPGVYFFRRTNCYILDIENQLLKKPEIEATGAATCALLIKTTPHKTDYVKTGVYKRNQTFEVIDKTPVDGHYKVYYRGGEYYVNAQFVNLKLKNVAKPTITYTAKIKSGDYDYINIRTEASKDSVLVGSAKTGALIDVIEKDYNDTYAKIWFNSKECYIQTEFLTSFKETPSNSGTASATGNQAETKQTVANTQPIYVDTNRYDVLAYNINGNNYFKLRDIAQLLTGSAKTFDIEYDASTNSINMLSLFDYTSVGGELTKGDGKTRNAAVSTAFLTYDGVPVSVACYNIDGNNYFKLRDVTDVLDCKVEWDNENQLIKIITTLPAKEDMNAPKG